METKIGKIAEVRFGHGGYQDAMLGIHFTLSGKSWGVGSTMSEWDSELIKCDKHAKWTEKDRSKNYDEIMRYVSKLLADANVSEIRQLIGKPVEVTFENRTIKSFRILTEAI